MRRPNWRIGTRLMLAQAVVLIAAIATAALIASVVGPPLFHDHMLKADHSPDPSELEHVEQAFRDASVLSLGLAMAAALLISLAVSWYLTRRIQTPLTTLTEAAAQVSGGRCNVRVPVGDAGPEIDSLAATFNTMAGQLAHTEDTRRRLLSDLAHELRTPVATLTAYLEGIEDGVTPWNSETRTILADQVLRLSRLAQDLDAVSRAQEGRLTLDRAAVSINELVETACRAQSEPFAAKGVELVVNPGPDRVIRADRARLLQVLTNLLDNARRHTPAGGRVIVEWHSADRQVVISVSDTGEGIPASQLTHVFERFYRGDSARDREQQGSGIGLTISRAIAEAHGGRLDAYSDGEGEGATFVMTLPIPPARKDSP